MNTAAAELNARWMHLHQGAALAANLTTCAREQTLEHLGAAVSLLTREQLEATVTALVLLTDQQAPDAQ